MPMSLGCGSLVVARASWDIRMISERPPTRPERDVGAPAARAERWPLPCRATRRSGCLPRRITQRFRGANGATLFGIALGAVVTGCSGHSEGVHLEQCPQPTNETAIKSTPSDGGTRSQADGGSIADSDACDRVAWQPPATCLDWFFMWQRLPLNHPIPDACRRDAGSFADYMATFYYRGHGDFVSYRRQAEGLVHTIGSECRDCAVVVYRDLGISFATEEPRDLARADEANRTGCGLALRGRRLVELLGQPHPCERVDSHDVLAYEYHTRRDACIRFREHEGMEPRYRGPFGAVY
jgi:hypothetical protein